MDKVSSPKRAAKKPTLVTVTKVKKTPTVRRKTVAAPKVSPKPTPRKKVVSKKVGVKKKPPVIQADTEEVSFVPGTLSLRLQEKKEIYVQWYREHSDDLAIPIAKISGYTFIAFGLLAAFFNWLTIDSRLANLTAFVGCVDGELCPKVADPVVTSPTSTHATVTFLPLPPITETSDLELSFIATNASWMEVRIQNQVTGLELILPETGNDGTNYTFTIPSLTLLPGEYSVFVETKHGAQSIRSLFSGPNFVIADQIDPEVLGVSTTTIQEINESEEALTEGEASNASLSSTTEESRAQDEVAEELPLDVTTETDPQTPTESKIPMVINQGVKSDQYRIEITPVYQYERIELELQPQQAVQSLFLGTAIESEGIWVYWIDATTIPVGSYEVTAKAYIGNDLKEKSSIPLVVETKITPAEELPDTVNQILENADYQMLVSELTNSINLESVLPVSTSTADLPSIRNTVQTVLVENSDALTDLLGRYAIAVAGPEGDYVSLIESQITSVLTDIALASKATEKVAHSNLLNDLKAELDYIKDQITEQVSDIADQFPYVALDTDRDGITDFVELTKYSTKPNSADSDQDGVIDGVEVFLGSNPMDATPKGLVSFTNPESLDSVNESLVAISAIEPLLYYKTDTSVPELQVEVRGTSLPDSFVMIYFGKKPTLGFAKTDQEGNFSYIYSSQIADGEYEVYAALLDTQGIPVIRGTVYTLAKAAGEFTKVQPDKPTTPQVAASISATQNYAIYNVVGGVGLVAFGLILLLLAQTVATQRQRTKVVET